MRIFDFVKDRVYKENKVLHKTAESELTESAIKPSKKRNASKKKKKI